MDNNNVLSGMNKQRKFSPPTHQLQQQQQQSSLLNEPSSSSSLSTTNSIQPSSSPTSSTMTTTIVATNSNQRDTFDITQYLNDSSFDAVELSDEIEFRFELIEFDVFMEILGCKINEESDLFKNGNIPQQQQQERSKLMSRIVKIMKKLHGNDPDTARRFARLKRRSKEKQNSTDNESKTGVFKTPCRFYIEGKCHKGSDCLYSHDVSIPKRKELCKFYLQGKGDDCLFMHSEFPCKFFHTNTKCYAGENCRFSHQTLTDEMREILRSYLDSGTFPDEVKPYWPINNPNDWIKDVDDPDSNDYDYDALLSNKTRKVLLGPPNEKMKNSLETWKWQQELKESEQSYTGAKRNLFSIDDGLVLKEKPPTPRLEEDDEVIEAHIQSYYNDLLDTDDYDEMIHLKEIEELEQKLKQEEEIRKQQSILDPPPPSTTTEFPNPTIVSDSSTLQQQSSTTEELSEEEKRLIEASMKDEDLRILPNQPFVLPAAFGGPPTTPIPMAQPSTVLDVNQTTPPYVSNFNSPHHNPFGLPQPLLDGGGQPVLDSKPFGINNNIDPSPQSMLPVQTQQPSQDPRTRDPRIRDPRLNNSNRLVPNVVTTTATTSVTNVSSNSNISGGGPSPSISTQSTVLSTTVNSIKPENKVIKSNTQNLVIKYKLIGVEVNAIDYSVYYESYQVDNSLRCDPRLKRFFDNLSSSSPRINTNFTNTVDQSTDQVQESNFPKSSTESFMMTGQKKSSPSQSVIITKPQPLSLSSQSSLPSSSSSNIIISRDPRMRNRINDNDLRNSLDTKNSDSNTSIISTNSTDQTITTTTSPLSLTTNTLTTSVVENSEMNTSTKSKNNSTVVVSDQNTQNNLTEIINCKNNDRSSIPSYALSALLPTTQSLFSSVTGNSLLPFNKTSTNTESLLLIDSNNINNDDDDDDDDDEEDQLKVDENPIDSTLINDGESSSNETKLWPKISIGNNLINNDVTNTTTTKTLSVIDSSDNEMEIDLRISSTSTNLFDKNNALNSNLINVHQPPSLSSSKSQLSSLTSTTIEAAIKNQDDNQNNSSNNESESEYENELIIATSSSEQEDNLLLSNSSSLLNNNNNNNIDEQQLQKQQQQNNIVSSCGDL
uniref:Ras guanine nucleotide exchange factor P-like n=1 Tax=Dermatophagoides pteronyssinus TaxID=6956 RepID=A0A6P6YF65_DERPT|nr:ras guanine nucleotide exchange factor P-like [Dermatophagoides pteronyssinus]